MTAIHVLDFDEDGNVIGADDYALVNPKSFHILKTILFKRW